MAVNLFEPSELNAVEGVEIATTAAGIRYQGRDDLVLIKLADSASTAAVFTQNKCCAAPVVLAKEHLATESPRALLINSGNANAVTAQLGLDNAKASCDAVAGQLGICAEQVLPFSTGVIGEQLNMPAMLNGICSLKANLSADNWMSAAKAIMTTDTVAKAASSSVMLGNQQINITGIAKGSGMICPNMATMLAYVACDAKLTQGALQLMLEKAVANSFNQISVDSDTSTNDALVLVATGAKSKELDDQQQELLYQAIERIMIELATSIVRDGEGATKFITIDVEGAASREDAAAIAYSVAHSPLVKTAFFASDPNWGRILMAIGKASVEQLNMDIIDVLINDLPLIRDGSPDASYTENAGKLEFEKDEINLSIHLNLGQQNYRVWTSDLSHDYVSINADYRS